MSIVYKKDGKYLVCNESFSHVGTRVSIRWTDNLHEATVIYGPLSHKAREQIGECERVQVVETRTVTIVEQPKPPTTSSKPTGFVATCKCGAVIGAMDYERTDRADAAKILGRWLMNWCTVSPRFSGRWSTHIEPCQCHLYETET